ncbi:MAG: Tat pathway signal protein [Desulfuromonadales bacterium]|nr:Tat pathway signal protein [Desulfuromonadales bacterium]
MVTRRQFILSAAAMAAGPLTLGACSSVTLNENYKAAARRTWRHDESRIHDSSLLQRELVRYATLAPSSHNTQCWKFHIEEQAISVLPDLARQCPAVDPDDHHLFVSLGCATENLIQAARANGLKGEARFNATAAGGIKINLEPARADVSPLFQAIPERQCTRAEFDGKPLSTGELSLLEHSGTGDGVRVLFLTEKAALEQVLEYVVAGNTAQMNDPAFVEELETWIRFNGDEAIRTGDGLFSGTSENPSVPRWLGSLLFGMFFTKKNENDKYTRHIRSSAGIAIFFSESNDRARWVEVGRCYERFALQATTLGIRTAMLNQPVEVSALRPQFATFLGIGSNRPDLVVRFGRGPRMPQSLRRPVQSVLV